MNNTIEDTQKNTKEHEYLTVKEVADLLQKPKAWVSSQCHKRNIPSIKLGKSWRISKRKLDSYLKYLEETAC